jgi:chromosomal replication initiator protein
MDNVLIKDCKTVWENCLQTIKSLVSEQSFKTWFAPIVANTLTDKTLNIKVPNPLFIEYIEEHFIHALHEAIVKELGPNARLEYTISNIPQKPQNTTSSTPEKRRPFEFNNEVEEKMYYDTFLNPNYTFENFIEGDCNKFARAASLAVSDKPGQTSFNPLMVYGGVGLGKTHLIQSIGNKIKTLHPEKFVIYISSDKFIGQFTEFAQHNRLKEFENFFRLVDVLIIDDVQYFAKKEGTMAMFFNIFNEMHQNRKQIILTSDVAPKDIVGLQNAYFLVLNGV